MAEPIYTVFIRVPMLRGDFVDPPAVNWDARKDEALWKILSAAGKKEVDWNEVADRFEVPVDFLFQQVAFLTERHASQVRAQVRRATVAAKGSSGPSPIPPSDSTGLSHQRVPSALSTRRDSPMLRSDAASGVGTPLTLSARPIASRNTSGGTIAARDTGAPMSPRPGAGVAGLGRSGADARKRLSSLPITSKPTRSPERTPGTETERTASNERNLSPGPAESSSTTSSEDESGPVQSRIIRRPPRFQQKEPVSTFDEEEEEEDEPAFQAYEASPDRTAQDLGSTLRGDSRAATRRFSKALGKRSLHRSHNSDSSSGSAAMVQRPGITRDQRTPGPLSPHRPEEQQGRSSVLKSRGYSREGSEGTPSMGSSYSDLDDASISQSALEEALASHMNRPGGSRFSISQAFRSRHTPGPGQ